MRICSTRLRSQAQTETWEDWNRVMNSSIRTSCPRDSTLRHEMGMVQLNEAKFRPKWWQSRVQRLLVLIYFLSAIWAREVCRRKIVSYHLHRWYCIMSNTKCPTKSPQPWPLTPREAAHRLTKHIKWRQLAVNKASYLLPPSPSRDRKCTRRVKKDWKRLRQRRTLYSWRMLAIQQDPNSTKWLIVFRSTKTILRKSSGTKPPAAR